MTTQSHPATSTAEAGPAAVPARPMHEIGLVADPTSLGLAAFATTTFVFGLSYTTLWNSNVSVASTLQLALIYGGAIQVLAGIWAFARRSTFPAVTFCSYGAFYVGYYVYITSIAPGVRGRDAATSLALFLLAWMIFSSYVWIASLQVSGVDAAVFFFWWLAYLLLVIGEFLGNTNVIIGGGAAAIASAATAWYASGALLINVTFGKDRLPLFATHSR